MDEQPRGGVSSPPPAKTDPVGPDYWKRSRSRWLYVVLAVIVLAALAAYWFLLKQKPVSKPTTSNQTVLQKSGGEITKTTQHYDSDNFQLGFDYPKDWTVNDVAGSGIMTVTSPPLQLVDASGQTVAGRVVLTIRDKSQKLSEFDKGNAVAVRDSEKIAYSKPSPSQRGNTYQSFLQYATTPSGLDGIYITGDSGYQKGQAIPLVDVSKIDPVISVIFQKCSDSKCTTHTPLAISPSMLGNPGFDGPLTDMLKSMSIS